MPSAKRFRDVAKCLREAAERRREMNLDDLTLGEAKKLVAMLGPNPAMPEHPYRVGEAVFIRN